MRSGNRWGEGGRAAQISRTKNAVAAPKAAQPSRPFNQDSLFHRSVLLVVGSAAAMLMLTTPWSPRPSSQATAPDLPCQDVAQTHTGLSREALLRVLSVPERSPVQMLRDIVNEPYCVLPTLEIRAGIMAEREVFPLAFDPQTWLVVLYEDGEYAGYAFYINRK